MYKCALLLFLALHNVATERTFTIVLDTTYSMSDELNIIRANIVNQVLHTVHAKDFGNYVLVSFNDTGSPNILVTTTAFTSEANRKFITHLNNLRISGGNKCPENSLTGIEVALNASPETPSLIFLFTDAYAYDYDKYDTVEKLCKENHSQLIIFLTGYCFRDNDATEVGNVDVYYNLAKSCSGAVIKFELINDLRQAFRFMKEIANVDWTDVKNYDFKNYETFSFSVDSFTTDFMLVVTGESPSVETSIIYSGISRRQIKMDVVLETKYALVLLLPHSSEIGEYTANIRGRGNMTLTLYERNFIPFEFGFSTKKPRNLQETSSRPLPGFTNYILVKVDRSIKLRMIEWLVDGDSAKLILHLRELSPGLYAGSVYVHPDKAFRFWVVGEDSDTHKPLKTSSKFIYPQMPGKKTRIMAPVVEILDKDLEPIDYEASLTLACLVNAHPKPSIQWKDQEGNYLTSEDALLEMPYTYISYVTIPHVLKNSTITCYADNYEGSSSTSIDIFVNRTYFFNVIQTPQDASVEYESSHYLYCEVDAYPIAKVYWYLNDTLLDAYTNARITFEENAIVIRKMDFEDAGEYECRAVNEVETKRFKAHVVITGLDAPELGDAKADYSLKEGDSVTMECRIVKGKPAPQITWKYKSLQDYEFTDIPFGSSTSDSKLFIKYVEKSNVGVYRCIASNIVGEDALEFNISVKYAPIIKDLYENNKVVTREQNKVNLSCDVDSNPQANVWWELLNNGFLKPFHQNHRTDENNNHYFTAQSSDSGEYHCIAENEVGRAEKIITVQVQVRPYIRSPENKMVQTITGASVDLVCDVLEGNPEPTIEWDFQAEGSSAYNVFNRGNASLHLENVNQYTAGTYVCNAKNSLGFDNIRYRVVVQ